MDFMYCYECGCWVYAKDFVMDKQPRMCRACWYGEELAHHLPDPSYGKTECVWCGSFETEKVGDTEQYLCRECNDTFYKIL